jgi:hypothetical protein
MLSSTVKGYEENSRDMKKFYGISGQSLKYFWIDHETNYSRSWTSSFALVDCRDTRLARPLYFTCIYMVVARNKTVGRRRCTSKVELGAGHGIPGSEESWKAGKLEPCPCRRRAYGVCMPG